MGMITAQRIASALLGGSMDGAALQALLDTPSGLAGWKFCCAGDGLRSLLMADPAALAVWTASGRAVDVMAQVWQPYAALLAADRAAMASIFSAASRADTWFATEKLRSEIWGSDAALTALAQSPTGLARALACSKYARAEVTLRQESFEIPVPKRLILLRWGGTHSGGSATVGIVGGRRTNSLIGTLNGSVYPNSAVNVVALIAPVTVYGTYGGQAWFEYVEV